MTCIAKRYFPIQVSFSFEVVEKSTRRHECDVHSVEQVEILDGRISMIQLGTSPVRKTKQTCSEDRNPKLISPDCRELSYVSFCYEIKPKLSSRNELKVNLSGFFYILGANPVYRICECIHLSAESSWFKCSSQFSFSPFFAFKNRSLTSPL